MKQRMNKTLAKMIRQSGAYHELCLIMKRNEAFKVLEDLVCNSGLSVEGYHADTTGENDFEYITPILLIKVSKADILSHVLDPELDDYQPSTRKYLTSQYLYGVVGWDDHKGVEFWSSLTKRIDKRCIYLRSINNG